MSRPPRDLSDKGYLPEKEGEQAFQCGCRLWVQVIEPWGKALVVDPCSDLNCTVQRVLREETKLADMPVKFIPRGLLKHG